MDLKYVVMIIIKILISVPTAMLITSKDVNGVALMGGHLDNKNSSAPLLTDYELYDDQEIHDTNPTIETTNSTGWKKNEQTSEEIPDPSPLVVPGYNLPENIFNRGKPFYLERDPLTGNVNFDSKPALSDVEEGDIGEYDEDNYSKEDMLDKANIDRKDSNYGSHKSSDVNQLVPNFHDFLNLPVKYNSDKYVYPLISSSYANTKVQGNVNKHQNHKNYVHTITQRPAAAATSPSYYYNTKNSPQTTTTMKTESMGDLEMQNYEDYEEYDFTTKKNVDNIYFTTAKLVMTSPTATTTTTASPTTTMKTTKKPLSIFQQLFGDYEETETETVPFIQQRPISDNTHMSSTTVRTNGAAESNYYDYEYEDIVDDTKKNVTTESATTMAPPRPSTTETTTEKIVTTTTATTTTTKIHSHPTIFHHQTLPSERVTYQSVPSTTIHVPAHQDTASFLVGNHQNVMGGEYVGSVVEENLQTTDRRRTETDRPFSGSAVTLHPFKHSEASLAIGVPVDRVKGVPGQVVDEKLEANGGEIGKNKVVFPDEKHTGHLPELKPPKLPPNRKILKLNSRPMYHQLPSSLTPPKEPDVPQPSKFGASRPPWDPRPDRYFNARPEYARPPRPPFDSNLAHKRVDNLPNILPQFRPNALPNKSYTRPPPLFDRHLNRHVGVYEKLQPPPPPPKYLTALRKAAFPDQNEKSLKRPPPEQLNYYQTPPQVILPNRRHGLNDDVEVETLQMIQAKQSEKQEGEENKIVNKTETETMASHDKPLYVVYPVNTAPLKLDAFDTPKKETVVIGTRAELPLPPSKINLEQGDLFNTKDRNEAPILKPHLKPAKSDFPYPLEKPNPSALSEQADFWNTVGNSETKHDNRISVTLRTHTERPIAVAYSPTEAHERYSVPNYAGAVIPEIRPGGDREFTLTAVMQPQQHILTHRSDGNSETTRVPAQDFEAPFQASVNVDSASQGWLVVRDKSKAEMEQSNVEVTTVPLVTTSEFDIENFKPQLIGGFVPIYDYPEDRGKSKSDKRER